MKKTLWGWLAGWSILFASTTFSAPTTPTRDFTDNGDGTVTHKLTGLTWMRCAMGMTMETTRRGTDCTGTASTHTWDQARTLTANFAGKADWRLPSIAELNTIVERESAGQAINATIFPNTPTDHIWSGSPFAGFSELAWAIVGNNGFSRTISRSESHPVRIVRGGRSFDPLVSYTPTTDFVDNGDGTATHVKTGLMWKRCAEGQTWNGSTCSGVAATYSWDTAIALTSSSAGHKDWRLPTEFELLTIAEYQTIYPAINTTIFPGTLDSEFWSGSTWGELYAWVVRFDFGSGGADSRSSSKSVRLVRIGQFFSSLGFTPQSGVTPNAAIASGSLKVASVSGATPISITNGSYSINGGVFTTAPGSVNLNDNVRVSVTASSSFATTTTTTLTIGIVSGDFSVTTAAMADRQPPSEPGNLTATADGDNTIDLSWEAALDNVGVTAYQVYRSGIWIATLGNVKSYADTGLNAAITYTYRVAACDAAGNCSAQSASASATTRAAFMATSTAPTKEFSDNGDGTVTHRITGLTWMRCVMGMTWTGTTCTGTAVSYTWNQAGGLTANFAGKGDWRLPSIAELNTLAERGTVTSVNSTMFPNTPETFFWSATPSANTAYPNYAWWVPKNGGATVGSTGNAFSVRLVRGGPPFDPLASYTPTTDFVDNGDGTATHLKTGLMWKRCAEGQTWNGSTCSGMAGTYGWGTAIALTSSSAGYTDWRVPTENELLTIVEYQAYGPAINTTIFPNTLATTSWSGYGFFWSGSPYVGYAASSWYVGFDGGFSSPSSRDATRSVRFVRAGQFFSPLGFPSQTNATPNAPITSYALKVAGISGPTPISVAGGSYAINGGTYTTAPGMVNPSESVAVRVTVSAGFSTSTRATLTIGGISGDFSVTTRADTQPPSSISLLTAAAVSASQVDLAWIRSSDSAGVSAYRVYRNGVLLAVTGNVTNYSDTQLAGTTRFNYTVTACNATNNCSPPSSVAAVTISGSAKTLPMLAAGASHSVGLKSGGGLWTWGYNNSGQLGTGATADSSTRPQSSGSGFIAVALGGSHSVAIKTDSSLWTWGGNASGQLGDGTTAIRSSPAQIGSGYIVVAAGSAHTLVIKDDGSLWAWGNNGSGRLGEGTTNQHNTPAQIGTGYYAVAAGTAHSVALKFDGGLWAWGSNNYGQLGDGTGNDRYAPTLIGTGFTAVAAGAFHTIALKTDGSLWAWGRNDAGQLGDGTGQNRFLPLLIGAGFSAVSGGASHTVALKTDGTVFAWGANDSGQLGDNTTSPRSSPDRVPDLSRVIAVAAGADFSLVLKSDGTVWGWGGNNAGQLGNGTLATNLVPGFTVNSDANGLLDLDPSQTKDAVTQLLPFFLVAHKTTANLSTTLTDSRAAGIHGAVYFGALVPPHSPLLNLNAFAADLAGAVPIVLGRGGVKQTGPMLAAASAYEGALTTGNQFAVYSGVGADPLTESNAIICMGVTIPELSAKGQVLMRPIANGDSMKGVTQCPTIQTPATLQLYRGSASGSISNLTLTATITPQPEDRGLTRNIYSWAVAPDGRQFMQTGPNTWAEMREPMTAAATVVVPADGNPVTLPVVQNANLSSIAGTLVYVGLGSSWTDVKQLNKAGHYYTLQ